LLIAKAQRDRILMKRIGLKGRDFRNRHRTALQFERMHGSGRQATEVRRIGCAQITLGGHVQAHGLCDLGTEMRSQPVRTGLLVARIGDPIRQIRGDIHDQVTDVVQERGNHDRLGSAARCREVGALQSMLDLRNGLAKVFALRACGVEAVRSH
jgi:hypothetical protein